jgi:hypothetical protein
MAWPNRFIGDKTAKNRPRILSLMRNCELEKTRQKPTSGLLKSKKKPHLAAVLVTCAGANSDSPLRRSKVWPTIPAGPS